MSSGYLPNGWCLTTLGEAVVPSHKRLNPQDHGELPYIGMEHIEPHTMRLLGTVPANEMKSSADSFKSGDVLYGRLRPYLNKVYVPDFDGLCSTEFMIFRQVPHIHSKYLQYFLNSWEFVQFANSLNAGDRPRVKFEQLSNYPFPLPPLEDQKRIVEKIEELLTQIESGIESLRRVQAKLKRYKASVLKAACEGRLAAQQPGDEPAAALLRRLGKQPLEADGLPELPGGWCWATLDQICSLFIDSAHRTPKYSQDGFPALGPRDVVAGNLDLKNSRHVGEDEYSIQTKRYTPQPGDFVYSRELSYGWGAIIPEGVKVCLSQGMCLFRLLETMNSNYFLYLLNGPIGRQQADKSATGSAHPHINLSDIKGYLFPIPPAREQSHIVNAVEQRLSVAAAAEQAAAAGLRRAGRLRQAVLKAAFEGRLV